MSFETIQQEGAFDATVRTQINENFGQAVNQDSGTLNSPTINQPVAGTAFGDLTTKTDVVRITGAELHAGVLNWQNPESVTAIIKRVFLNVLTVATGACTVDVGVTAVSATTGSDTLLDGVDVNAAIAIFDSMNAALDAGANAKAQLVAAAKWITVQEKTGDATGLVADLIIEYVNAPAA